jgi:hypothetical protein
VRKRLSFISEYNKVSRHGEKKKKQDFPLFPCLVWLLPLAMETRYVDKIPLSITP